MFPFALTIFLSAFLLFQVQPLIGKYILPWFGGGPAVWTTCMLFFQVVLLGGYAWSHLVTSRFSARTQSWLQAGLLLGAACLLPIGPDPSTWKPTEFDSPAQSILILLLVNVGLPTFVLSTTAPLLQRWFGRAFPGRSPYRLYALSNAGSLLALLSYPLLVEPFLQLGRQTHIWSLAFVLFALGTLWCALKARLHKAEAPAQEPAVDSLSVDAAVKALEADDPPPVAASRRPNVLSITLWILLSAAGSAMLLATTNQLCQEVAVVPFLWIVPLSVYLITFIICFDQERWFSRLWSAPWLLVAVPIMCSVYTEGVDAELWKQVAAYSAVLFACCINCHGELVRSKPHPRHLTLFYLCIAFGGALGGLFTAILAPRLFLGFWEFHIALGACCLLTLCCWLLDRPWERIIGGRSWRPDPRHVTWLYVVLCIVIAVVLGHEAAAVTSENALKTPLSLASLRDDFFGSAAAVLGHFADRLEFYVALEHLCALAAVFWWIGRARERAFRDNLGSACTCAITIIAGGSLVYLAMFLNGQVQEESSSRSCLHRVRNFYGILKVTEYSDSVGEKRSLTNGRICHGFQYTDDDKRRWATSYYGPKSGFGLAMTHHPRRHASDPALRNLRLGVVGLGTGSTAAYGQAGDYIRFYDINPEVIQVSEGYFTYREDCPEPPDVVLGDARISMERELVKGTPQQFDVLAVDAFTSDSIPVHLLTRECADIYWSHLKPDGLLLVHISNRFLDLEPVTLGLAIHTGCIAALVSSDGDDDKGIDSASWVILTNNAEFLTTQEVADEIDEFLTEVGATDSETEKDAAHWQPIFWTDSFASLWQIAHFK